MSLLNDKPPLSEALSHVRYDNRAMSEWSGVDADIGITDPPFGIEFDGQASNYNRSSTPVADSYIDWPKEEYASKIRTLLSVFDDNIAEGGQILVFSGMNNADIIHQEIRDSIWRFQGKLYWAYNFAPYCSRRPAHNVYEIFWATKSESWYYDNECSYKHCHIGESNLSLLDVPREYQRDGTKYQTQLPLMVVEILLEHFSEEEDVVFDPLAGSGSVGLSAIGMGRRAIMGDLNEEAKEVFNDRIENHF